MYLKKKHEDLISYVWIKNPAKQDCISNW